jgi:hypothetical protein
VHNTAECKQSVAHNDQLVLMVLAVSLCTSSGIVVAFCTCQRRRPAAGDDQTTKKQFYGGMSVYGAMSIIMVVVFARSEAAHTNTFKLEIWDLVCVLVTLATLLCVPRIVTGFKQQLADVTGPDRPALRVGQESTGWCGTMMFVWGLFDLCFDIGQSVSLASCGHWWLFACSTATLLATFTVSIYLGKHMLLSVARGNEEARNWIAGHGKLVALVVLASSSRLESVAILRLRLCDQDIIKLPIEPAYFHFIRHAGMFHVLLEDLPHGLVGVAQLTAGKNMCGGNDNFHMPVDAETILKLNLIFSLGSIVFGVILRSTQMSVFRAARDVDNGIPLLQ